MRVLVLGGTGFIGGHIARAAIDSGWSGRALCRNLRTSELLAGASVEWVEGDLDSVDGLENAFKDIDVVFHAAGYYPHNSQQVQAQVARSMQQTNNVLALMRMGSVKRLVYTSSFTTMVSTTDSGEDLVDEGTQYQPGELPLSAYYECKIAMEQVLLDPENRDMDIVIMNPTLVLGPGGNNKGTDSVLLALARGWGLAWLEAIVNVVDVRDVAQAHVQAASSGRSGERYLLGGHNLELRQLIEHVAAASGVAGPRFKLPMGVVDILVWMEDCIPWVNMYANHLRALKFGPRFSNQKAREHLKLDFRPLEDTIINTLESYRSQGYL